MGAFYSIESIRLEDYDGMKEECPLSDILPLFHRTENKPPRFVEDKCIEWCNQVYQHQWTKIKLVIKYL